MTTWGDLFRAYRIRNVLLGALVDARWLGTWKTATFRGKGGGHRAQRTATSGVESLQPAPAEGCEEEWDLHDVPLEAGVVEPDVVRRVARQAQGVMSWRPVRGELVVVWRDNGTAFVTTVRDVGESGGVAVAWVEGISGFYALNCVRPVAFHESARASAVSGKG